MSKKNNKVVSNSRPLTSSEINKIYSEKTYEDTKKQLESLGSMLGKHLVGWLYDQAINWILR